jgi:pimeloyl-ACP methyl ester carboxylesterase
MKLFFRKFGEGQPVVILHGVFGLSDNWVTIGKRLAENFGVFIPDMRNHGQSPHSSAFSYDAMADDLAEFLEDHALVNPILIGHSMGGKVVMKFALDFPAKPERIVVIDISPRAYPVRQSHMQLMDSMLSVDFAAARSRREVEDQLSLMIREQKIRNIVLKNLYHINKDTLGWRLNLAAISEHTEELYAGVTSPYVFKKPALFIRGALSDYVTDEDADLIRKNFPRAEFVTLEGASHWVHADVPGLLCRSLSSFLGRQCNLETGRDQAP